MSDLQNHSMPNFRLAEWGEQEKIIDFINEHFGWKLPLINREEFFSHYFVGKNLQFALAERSGELLSVAGYILANKSETPDVWVSIWVAKKGENGVGLELMNAIPTLLNARTVACNNIKEKTCVFYRFLGWQAERLSHFYRLCKHTDSVKFKLVKFSESTAEFCKFPLEISGNLTLEKVHSEAELEALGLPFETTGQKAPQTPNKDLWYLKRRYFDFPHYDYDVWVAKEQNLPLAYLVTRTAQSPLENGEKVAVLRIVDFIGDEELLPRLGTAIDTLIANSNAEYVDCYCAGISAETFEKAGFFERKRDDEIVIPNYLDPPLFENTEYFYFTNNSENFRMFKADGDQDRANLSV